MRCSLCTAEVEESKLFSHVESVHVGLGQDINVICSECPFQVPRARMDLMANHCLLLKHIPSGVRTDWRKEGDRTLEIFKIVFDMKSQKTHFSADNTQGHKPTPSHLKVSKRSSSSELSMRASPSNSYSEAHGPKRLREILESGPSSLQNFARAESSPIASHPVQNQYRSPAPNCFAMSSLPVSRFETSNVSDVNTRFTNRPPSMLRYILDSAATDTVTSKRQFQSDPVADSREFELIHDGSCERRLNRQTSDSNCVEMRKGHRVVKPEIVSPVPLFDINSPEGNSGAQHPVADESNPLLDVQGGTSSNETNGNPAAGGQVSNGSRIGDVEGWSEAGIEVMGESSPSISPVTFNESLGHCSPEANVYNVLFPRSLAPNGRQGSGFPDIPLGEEGTPSPTEQCALCGAEIVAYQGERGGRKRLKVRFLTIHVLTHHMKHVRPFRCTGCEYSSCRRDMCFKHCRTCSFGGEVKSGVDGAMEEKIREMLLIAFPSVDSSARKIGIQ